MTTAERLIKIGENVPRVFSAGKEAEQNAFWDAYQQNGERTDYQLAFSGSGWTKENFRPKYDIRPTSGFEMFRGNKIAADLPALLEELGITLDISSVTSGSSLFYNTAFTRIGIVDTTGMSSLSYLFHNCKNLETIDALILREDGQQSVSSCFGGCSALKNIVFSGVLASNGLDLKDCVSLSADSIRSIIGCLSADTSGLFITLSSTAVANAFSDEEWQELKAQKNNWEIKLS